MSSSSASFDLKTFTGLVGSVFGCIAGGCALPANQAHIDLQVSGGSAYLRLTQAPDVSAALVGASGPRDPMTILAGAINETLGFRITFPSSATRARITAVTVEPLESAAGRIEPDSVTVYRILPVKVPRWPGWHIRSVAPVQRSTSRGDVLVPLYAPRGGLPLRMDSDEPLEFWIDLTIPKGTPAGDYHGAVTWDTAGSDLARMALSLTVWPVVLPDEDAVPFIADVDLRAFFRERVPPVTQLLHVMRSLRQHRLTPVLPRLAPTVQTDSRGRLTLGWEAYDHLVAPYMTGEAFADRRPSPVWPMPVDPLFATGDTAINALSDKSFRRAYLAQTAAHFEEKEWLDRTYFTLPPEAPIAADSENLVAEARLAHDGLAILTTLFPQDMRPYGWTTAPQPPNFEVNIWMPPAQFFDREVMDAQRAAGRRTWMRLDRPPYGGTTAIAGAEADILVLGWLASSLRAQAIHLGNVNAWPETTGSPDECLQHDAHTLIFPGDSFGLDEPVYSVRLKLLRRTLQDAALAQLLTQHGRAHVTQALRSTLVSYAGTGAYRTSFADGRRPGWRREASAYEQAREIMGGELATRVDSIDRSDEAGNRRHHATWRQFMSDQHGVELVADGVRLHPREAREALTADLEARLVVTNHGRVPLRGTVEWAALPEEWSATDGTSPIRELTSGHAERYTLTADGLIARHSGDGVLPLPVRFTAEDGTAADATVRLASLIAGTASIPPTIDGSLTDWPAGTVNVAGDFLLVSRDPGAAAPGPSDRPQRRTTAFVLRDASALYLAINVEADRAAFHDAPRRQRVAYEDLVPVGEELVEILIDPLNSGARTPDVLFHIVIKPSGATVAEIGLRHDPPFGVWRTWPVDIDVATAVFDDRWTAEIRIPFSAFGAVPIRHTIWGLNLTRFDLTAQEYSNWSGAAPNPFDPLSIGNLYLP